jgi:N-dimethylarginine dimethylaminohydrolase
MAVALPSTFATTGHVPRRRLAMCPPTYFAVSYSINPWMHPHRPVDPERALRQWQELRDTYVELGHEVMEIPAHPGLPDLVFTANAGLVIDGRALVSRFRHAERTGEEEVFYDWFTAQGYRTEQASLTNEGEGDYLVTGDVVLGGSGFRSDTWSYREVGRTFSRHVVPLRLIDPRFYHLDTALAVLDEQTVAYWPGAFSVRSRQELAHRFPNAVIASEADAVSFGLNAFSDGSHVVLSTGATGLIHQLERRGFIPVPVDLSELHKSGGSVKCCTLELRDGAP